MKTFTIPGLEIEFKQHVSSQSVSEDAYFLYLKAVQHIKGRSECATTGLDVASRVPTDGQSEIATTGKVLDLGTGNGILLLMLAKDFKDMYFTGIEIVKDLCEIAVYNLEKMSEYFIRIINYKILQANYTNLEDILFDEKYEIIISNPPYFPDKTGRMSTDIIRAISKFELYATIRQLLQSIKKYLAYDGSSFIIFPFTRNEEFVANCKELSLEINSYDFIDYTTKSFHVDLDKINSKTKVIYEVIHA